VADQLSAELIERALSTQFVGRHVLYLATAGSTNDEARRLAMAGAPDGTLVVADYQSAGRGRLDRRWEAPPGSSLLLSLLFRPALALERVQQLTMLCGLATAEAIEAETGLAAGCKWPNDLVINERKVAGILTELELSGERLAYVVVGIGLNVNLDPAVLPGPLLARATSLAAELGRPVTRLPLLLALLARVETRYQALSAGTADLHREWASRLVTLGRPVTVADGETEWMGMAEGVDNDGALLVRPPGGEPRRVVAGDVRVVDDSRP
jgi:BirA family transcriptional regulator, biotin operon repressor / biotin---[acetyl-CoA-carboxylase] ligase